MVPIERTAPVSGGAPRAAALGGLAAAGLGVNFAFQAGVLAGLGVSASADAVFGAWVVPQVLLAVLSGALAKAVVPLLAPMGESERRRAAWTLTHAVGAAAAAGAALLAVSAPAWVGWVLPGLAPETAALTAALVAPAAWGMAAGVAASVGLAALQAAGRFYAAEGAQLAASAAALAALPAALASGPAGVVWAMALRQAVLLCAALAGAGRWSPALERGVLAESWRRLGPILWGQGVYKLSFVADRFLASLAPAGSLALYGFAQQACGAGEQVLGRAMSVPVLPELSRLDRAGDRAGFRAVLRRNAFAVAATALAAYAVLVFAGKPVLGALAGTGRLVAGDLELLWLLLAALGGQIVLSPVLLVVANGFYAQGRTSVPSVVSAYGVPVGIVLKAAGFAWLGVAGLALGTSAYYLGLVAIYLLLFPQRAGRIHADAR